MNLSDLEDEGKKLDISMCELDKYIYKIEEIDAIFKNLLNPLFAYNFDRSIVDSNMDLKKIYEPKYANFKKSILDVDLINFAKLLGELKNEYKGQYFSVTEWIDKIVEGIGRIYKSLQNGNAEDLVDVYKEYDMILKSYKELKCEIASVEKINKFFNDVSNDNAIKIRLMSENSSFSDLIDNMANIKNLYDNINILIGDDSEDLEYIRAESGTFEIMLTGCITTILALIKVLDFIYKVYSENFSWKAKQDMEDGQQKLRGSIVKIVKEYGELKPEDQEIVQRCFAELEATGKKLFINNPFIKLNNQEIGLQEAKTGHIPKQLIESEIKRIDERQKLLENNNSEEVSN